MGDEAANASSELRNTDQMVEFALDDLDTEITSLQELYAGNRVGQDSPSTSQRTKRSQSAWRSSKYDKDVDDREHDLVTKDAINGRKINGRNQAGQISDYFVTVEERFEYLEKEVKSLRSWLRSSQVSIESEKPTRPEVRPSSPAVAPWIPKIRLIGQGDFYQEDPHVLQVLIGDIRSPRLSNMQNNLFEKANKPQTVPLRLRIRSRPLLALLEKMTDYTLLKHDEQQSLVLRYPYKPIIALAQPMSDLLTRLSAQPSQMGTKSTNELDDTSHGLRPGETDAEDKVCGAFHSKDESVAFYSDALSRERKDTHDSPTAYTKVHDEHEPESTGTEESVLLEHLRLLVAFMNDYLGSKIELSHHVNAGSLTRISFVDLWYLFNLGQEVVSLNEHEQVFRVISYNHAPSPIGREATELSDSGVLHFIVTCVFFDFDGDQYGPVKRIFTIPEYEGSRSITSLPVYPLACCPDTDAVRATILERGNKFINITSQQTVAHMMYYGLTLDTPQREVSSDIIIDFRMARLEEVPHVPKLGIDESVRDDTGATIKPLRLRCRCPVCLSNNLTGEEEFSGLENESRFLEANRDLLQIKLKTEMPCEQTWTVLLPRRLIAFILRDRKWAMLDIGSVTQVEHTDAFRWLVLPKGHREMLEALIQNHSRIAREQSSAIKSDLVRGKGPGLILLLHGVPGVGKSSSAEAAAAAAGRALLPITPAEIGTDVVEVERNLNRYCHLAETWGCFLLIDEADVFLASRTRTDLIRNSLVSVFLRILEYYSGILFLTTNRVGSFDEAFQSRIHLSIYYPALDKSTTRKIWKMNLERVQEVQDRLSVDFRGIMRFAKELFDEQSRQSQIWNGRQIRNAVQTAVTLARFDSVTDARAKLNASHFVSVAKSSKEFGDYMTETYGGATNSDIAAREALRSDDFRTGMTGIYTDQARSKYPASRYDAPPDDRLTKGRGRGKRIEPQWDSSDDGESDSDSESSENMILGKRGTQSSRI